MMGLSDAGKGFFAVMSFFAIVILLFTLMMFMFKPVEYSAECEISGVNIGINDTMNFTGFSLNNSKIRCDISGEVPLILIRSFAG